jgi:alanyl-tRNA synthetase
MEQIFKKYNLEVEGRIFEYREKNWWQRGDAIGELGGPDSETFYDTGKEHDKKFGDKCHVNCDCGKYIEIGNSVFMQYQKTANGWQELKNKNVDFGGGLERLCMVTQIKPNIFQTDLFNEAILKIEELSGRKYEDNNKAFEIIADHLKAATFIMGDEKGIAPSNTDQGYIVRRLIRRALRFAKQLGITQEDWTKEVASIYINFYKEVYPELNLNKNFIIEQLSKEEKKFEKTLEQGLKQLENIAYKISDGEFTDPIKRKKLSGVEAFNLYQTYGFPIEITLEICKEKGIIVDEAGFYEELKKHQDLSRTASAGKFKGGLADSSVETTKLHTASHLLLAALRKVLNNNVSQKGSNITAERLRFDFPNPEKLTPEQIKQVEDIVNEAIKEALPVHFEEMALDKAREIGATGVFNSKYGDKVKVYFIGTLGNYFSKEICGGPHVENISELHHFKIIKEESSSSGIRRIKAILD